MLKGLSIGEHLGDIIAATRRPELEELNLELNGIEPEFCQYLTMNINFETIRHLNISHNWIGLHGLERLKD